MIPRWHGRRVDRIDERLRSLSLVAAWGTRRAPRAREHLVGRSNPEKKSSDSSWSCWPRSGWPAPPMTRRAGRAGSATATAAPRVGARVRSRARKPVSRPRGATWVFVDSKDSKVYPIKNQAAIDADRDLGHAVTVTGRVNDDGTISVDSLAQAKCRSRPPLAACPVTLGGLRWLGSIA
jgi:hypothetical protein